MEDESGANQCAILSSVFETHSPTHNTIYWPTSPLSLYWTKDQHLLFEKSALETSDDFFSLLRRH